MEQLDILTSICGQPITTVEQWETFRRPELLNLLSVYEFGIRPMERPKDLHFEVTDVRENYLHTGVIRKDIRICFLNYSFPVELYLPAGSKKPCPVFVFPENEYYMERTDRSKTIDEPHLPIPEILRRGYAVAVIPVYYVSPDWKHQTRFKKGVFGAIQPDTDLRTDASWATISAWAWGCSRVLDYLETELAVCHTAAAVIGHSRCGKTALWAGATDQRFAMVIDNSSGCSGAAYTRGKKGEHLVDINISDWFCGNYHKYNDNEHMLPFDQHMLLALIAPRPLYVKSDALDEWADPDATVKSIRLASAAYELHGKPGAVLPEVIENETAYHEGTVAYHRDSGDHDLNRFDWGLYMDFADRYLK